MPVAAGGEPATGLGTIAIRTNDEDEVALEVSSRVPGGRETARRLPPGPRPVVPGVQAG